ncbi:hypothetical protein HDU82_001690 [Entophlyctis luteolus]|nr:hypothetical protein HDU82_001690 [Entophlyctis luteolus]
MTVELPNLQSTPVEIVQQIFSHFPPVTVLKFRRLCKWINACLLEPHFAVINMKPWLQTRSARSMLTSHSPDAYDRSWCHWPKTFQDYYVENTLKSMRSISWYAKGLSTCSIAASIGGLTRLTSLCLRNNMLVGRIPDGLWSLTELEICQLDGNRLEGEISAQVGNLSKLRVLQLGSNRLTGRIPPEIGLLTRLCTLDISNNCIGGTIPREIGNLGELETLNAGWNLLEGEIPDTFGDLGQLRFVDLEGNRLRGGLSADAVGGLARLERLVLRGNAIGGDIAALNNLLNLKTWVL